MGKPYRESRIGLWRRAWGKLPWTETKQLAVDVVAYRSTEPISHDGGPLKIQWYESFLRISPHVLRQRGMRIHPDVWETMPSINIPLTHIRGLRDILDEILEYPERYLSGEDTDWEDFVDEGPIAA